MSANETDEKAEAALSAKPPRKRRRWRRVMLIALAVFVLFYAYRMIAPFYDRAWFYGECQFPGVAPERRAFLEQKLAELKPTWPEIRIGPFGDAFAGLWIDWLNHQVPRDLNERLRARLAALDQLAKTPEEQVLATHLVMRDLGAHYRYTGRGLTGHSPARQHPIDPWVPYISYDYALNTIKLGFRLPILQTGRAHVSYLPRADQTGADLRGVTIQLDHLIKSIAGPWTGATTCPERLFTKGESLS